MLKLYFKQAWQLIVLNKFASAITIAGTAFAIMMIMTIIVVDRVNTISVVPEVNRDMTLYVANYEEVNSTAQIANSSSISYAYAKDYLLDLETPKLVALVNTIDPNKLWIVNKLGSSETFNAIVRQTDALYWDLLSFSFVEGRPFDMQEYQSGVKVTVISASMAEKNFQGRSAIGEIVEIQRLPFRVVGVVKDVSPIFKEAHGDVWVPVTSHETFTEEGGFLVMLLMNNKADRAAIASEIQGRERRYNTLNAPWKLTFSQPVSHKNYAVDAYSFDSKETATLIWGRYFKVALILLILLLVPAVNLTGLNLSVMQKRVAEIGIRKAFGAKKRVILLQMIYENMLTSLLGGLVGLGLSYAAVYHLSQWLFDIGSEGALPSYAMIDLSVFFIVVFFCILLNLLSTAIPAWRASRMNIIDSLYQNKNL